MQIIFIRWFYSFATVRNRDTIVDCGIGVLLCGMLVAVLVFLPYMLINNNNMYWRSLVSFRSYVATFAVIIIWCTVVVCCPCQQ